MDDVLICSKQRGGFCFLYVRENERGREMGGEIRTGEDGCGRLRGSGARCEPGGSVCQLLPGSARHPRHRCKQTHTHTHMACTLLYLELLCLIGNTRRQKQPDGGMHHTLSVRLIEGTAAAAAHCGWLGCWNTAFITLMH